MPHPRFASTAAAGLLLLVVAAFAVPAVAAQAKSPTPSDGADFGKAPARSSPLEPPSGSSLGAGATRTLWLVGWGALASVVGVVVVSSMSKTRPVAGDPLATAPGASVTRARAPRRAGASAPVPHRAAFESGRDLAYRASPATVEHALTLMRALGLGEARADTLATGERVVSVTACSSCLARKGRRKHRAGESPTGRCGFEQGFLAGAFETVLGREVRVVERRCGMGPHATCEFTIE